LEHAARVAKFENVARAQLHGVRNGGTIHACLSESTEVANFKSIFAAGDDCLLFRKKPIVADNDIVGGGFADGCLKFGEVEFLTLHLVVDDAENSHGCYGHDHRAIATDGLGNKFFFLFHPVYEFDAMLADEDNVAIDNLGFRNPYTVDEGAVGAVEVGQDILSPLPPDSCVIPGNAEVLDYNIVVARATNTDDVFVEGEFLDNLVAEL